MTPYQTRPYRILKVQKECADTWQFTLDCDLNPLPGQFVQVSVPSVGEAPISVASYDPKILILLIRNLGNVTSHIFRKKAGDYLDLRGPYGHGYPMEGLKGNDVVIVGGGTGFAPLRGIIEYIQAHRADYKTAWVYLGFRDPANVLFKRDIERWKEAFHISVTVDKPDAGWKGDVGVVTNYFMECCMTNQDKVVFTCGPPIMIKFVIEALTKLGFHDDQVFVSLERHMKCGVGKCGHCMVHGEYVCKDGPVFRYDRIKHITD
ncbi:FAD/NAD(P)-binding protein [Candidatus Woesearchaeota archaeon]|nr:FAD/NAD(P)-binding protein [Candidatus Woesearchaeota archaeon]